MCLEECGIVLLCPKILLKVEKNCALVPLLGNSTFFETLWPAFCLFIILSVFSQVLGDRILFCEWQRENFYVLYKKLGVCRTYTSRIDFCPSPPEASLLLASEEPPSFIFAALHGGFSSLSLKRSLREASLRLAHQKQASCLLLPGRHRVGGTLRKQGCRPLTEPCVRVRTRLLMHVFIFLSVSG